MTEAQVRDLVLKVLAPFVRNEEALLNATAETRIWEDLQVNSARFIDILLAFEEKLDIEIDDDEADGVNTVGDVTRLVLNYAKKQPDLVAKGISAVEQGLTS